MAEMLNLVNENDEVYDIRSRDDVYAHGLQYVRVVDAFIRNEAGEFWIPIRTDDKVIAPGGYDTGAAGHVEAGESYEEAFRKEVFEELGWNIDDLEWKQLAKLGPKDGLATVSMVYEITTRDEPAANPDDFKAAEWMTLTALASRIKAGHPAKSNILPILANVYDVRT